MEQLTEETVVIKRLVISMSRGYNHKTVHRYKALINKKGDKYLIYSIDREGYIEKSGRWINKDSKGIAITNVSNILDIHSSMYLGASNDNPINEENSFSILLEDISDKIIEREELFQEVYSRVTTDFSKLVANRKFI